MQGVLNVETTNVRLPEDSVTILRPLAQAMTLRADTVRSALRLDLTTLARLCVQASSLRTVEELSDFATRTLGRMLGLDCAQIALGEEGRSETTTFWRRPDSDLQPLTASSSHGRRQPHRRRLDIQRRRRRDVGIADPTRPGVACLDPAPRRRGAGGHAGRPHRVDARLDGEQTEAATLLAQQTAALIDVAQALRRERRAAVTDSLTGLLNRRGFDERLREEIGRATRTGRPLALVLADCDDLKRVNDSAGHEAGDRVLEAFANLLRHRNG